MGTNSSNAVPLISVILPVYNSARTLHRCLNSVYLQTWQNWEVLIVDSNSSDKTKEVCMNWVSRDPIRFHYYDIPDRFASSKLNYGVSKSKGERLFLLGSDNYLEPRVFEDCVRVASEGFEAAGVPVKDLTPASYIARCILLSVIPVRVTHYSNFVRKDVWERLGGVDSRIPYVDDVDFYERFMSSGYRLKVIESLSLHDQRISIRWMIYKAKYYSVGMSMLRRKRDIVNGTERASYVEIVTGMLRTLARNPKYMPGILIVSWIRVATKLFTRVGLALGIIR